MAITKLTSPRQDDSADCVPVKWGGTGSRTKAGAQRNLGLLVSSQANQPNQHGNLDENRLVPVNLFPPGIGSGVVPFLFGPETVKAGEDFFVYITNYDSFTTYVLDKGNTEAAYTVRQQKNMVFFEANGDNVGTFNFSVNGRSYQFVSEPNNFQYNLVISTAVKNFNLRTALIAAGWDTTTPVEATVTVTNTGVVGSTSINSPSFDTGNGYPEGSLLSLIVNGYIAGKGGNGGTGGNYGTAGQNGGPAIKSDSFLHVSGAGIILGGGGGGGGAGNTGLGVEVGGGGGGGAGSDVGLGGTGYSSGSNSSLTTGGTGGNRADGQTVGGKGGNLGQPGLPGWGDNGSGGTGGNPGTSATQLANLDLSGFTGTIQANWFTPVSITKSNEVSAAVTFTTVYPSHYVQSALVAADHASTDWEIYRNTAGFPLVDSVVASTTNKLSYTKQLAYETSYLARCRVRATNGDISEWSPMISFTTAVEPITFSAFMESFSTPVTQLSSFNTFYQDIEVSGSTVAGARFGFNTNRDPVQEVSIEVEVYKILIDEVTSAKSLGSLVASGPAGLSFPTGSEGSTAYVSGTWSNNRLRLGFFGGVPGFVWRARFKLGTIYSAWFGYFGSSYPAGGD